MLTILLQEVIQADAIGIFLLALIAAPFVIPAIVKKSKISDAEAIKRQYPDGVRKVIGWLPSSISYDTAKSIVDKQWAIASAQREHDEAERKKAEERRIRDKASTIRRACPNVCTGMTDAYIANNETSLRAAQKRYEQRKEEAKTICATYREGVTAVCGYMSGSFLSDSDIEKLVSNKSRIIAEHQKIERNKAELAQLTPQLSDLKKKYPLGVKETVREKGWSLTKADDVRMLLLIPGSLAERQEKEEKAILSSNVKLDPIIKSAKELAEKNSKVIAKNRITTQYGAKIAAKAMESIEAEDRYKAISSFLDTVKKNQDEFAEISVSHIKASLTNWGYYTYQFQNRYEDSLGHSKNCSLKVWQAFSEECCLDDSISYEFYPRYKENRISKTQLEGTYSYNEPTWIKVMAFVSSLKEKYGEELFVILANTDKLNSHAFENNFRTIKEKLSDAGIKYGFKIPKNTSRISNKTYVVIDIITENSNLIKYCEDIFSFRYGGDTAPDQGQTRVVFVTLLKCYDGSEIEALNKQKIKAKEEEERKAREEEERRRREAEQKRQDELDIVKAKTIARSYPIGFRQFFPDQSTVSVSAYEARSIIQRESSIKSFQDTLVRMNNCVSGGGVN